MRRVVLDVIQVVQAMLVALAILVGAWFLSVQLIVVPDLERSIANQETEIVLLRQELLEARQHQASLSLELDQLRKASVEMEAEALKLFEQVEELEKAKSELAAKLSKASATSDWTSGWTITHYSLNVESTGKTPGMKGYGITKSGRPVEEDVTIAVDPSVIPLGTWVEIELPDGTIMKRRADDTGGAVKGKKIDLYVADASYQELMQMGVVRNAKVRVLGKIPSI